MVHGKSLMNLVGWQRSGGIGEGKASIQEYFDYALIDAPLVGLVSDPAILSTQSDDVLLVMDAQDARKRPLRDTMHSLETVGAKVLGTVMSNVKVGKHGHYGYRYE